MNLPKNLLLVAMLSLAFHPIPSRAALGEDVKLSDHGKTVVLDNGIVSFEVDKASGAMLSTHYQGHSLLAEPGYLDWVAPKNNHLHDATFTVVTDPASNHGDLAEISIAQSGAGQPAPFDVDLHLVLRRGDSGYYAFAVFHHAASYPAASLGQARWVLRMDDHLFDFINVDEQRRHVMPPSDTPTKSLGPKESMMFTSGPFAGQITDKYHYFVDAGDHFVHGWTGTQSHLGAWIVNGSNEDRNGGPTKQHNDAHFGRMLFKILTCGHYGASGVSVAAGQEWSKIYGPWMFYCDQAGTNDALWADAQNKAKIERAAWPYSWMKNPAYPLEEGRGTVTGSITLKDPQDHGASMANAWVGLAAASPDWQKQSDGYQFWVHADPKGAFTIPHVRPGTYTLYAFTNGVIDEFRHDQVSVQAGKPTALGPLDWAPPHYGRQLWQIGTPDRTAKEYRHGNDYHHWGLWLKFPQEFPNGVNFLIGKSHERTDWNYAQVNVQQNGQWVGTTWNVLFALPDTTPKGTVTLRIAFASTHAAKMTIFVNGRQVDGFRTALDNAMIRAGIHGQYSIRDIPFDASLLKSGQNTIALQQSAGGNVQKSVMYDAIRLEEDDNRPFNATTDTSRSFPAATTTAKPAPEED